MPLAQVLGIVVSFLLTVSLALSTWILRTLTVQGKQTDRLELELRYLTGQVKGDPPTAGLLRDVLELRSDRHWVSNCITAFHERLETLEEHNHLPTRDLPQRRQPLF